MFDFLKEYLDSRVSPELTSLFIEASQTLVDFRVDTHVFYFEQELSNNETKETSSLIENIQSTLINLLKGIISNFGVEVSSEATLYQCLDLVKALSLIDNYEDLETINSRILGSEGNVASLSDVLELTGSLNSIDYMSFIDSVSQELLDKIEELSKEPNIEESVSEDLFNEIRARLLKFKSFVKDFDNSLIGNRIKDGLKLGMDIRELDHLQWSELESLDSDTIASELVGLVLVSNLPKYSLSKAISKELDNLHFDVDKLTTVSVAANRLLGSIYDAKA